MPNVESLKEQLKKYGITNLKELDVALAKNLKELDIGIMTSDVTSVIKEVDKAV